MKEPAAVESEARPGGHVRSFPAGWSHRPRFPLLRNSNGTAERPVPGPLPTHDRSYACCAVAGPVSATTSGGGRRDWACRTTLKLG
ncbi:hypothetical protein C882_3606 [Caenispirillum salinarum AK4]|uniref:Uncharacterized protein n=1 Tax=Caenispirillum salinarum AK4 TaxID=1238182 RepID=K9H449_9PROT|nr:hypothetical protein C882_3606 [Caenispirillum salinarum AK4]